MAAYSAPLVTGSVIQCPWCNNLNIFSFPEQLKQHVRQHIYEDLQGQKISKQEIAVQQQGQLKRYLESLLG